MSDSDNTRPGAGSASPQTPSGDGPQDPAAPQSGGAAEPGEPVAGDGGYAPATGGEAGSYTQDVAMMRAEIDHIDTTVVPHYELLIAQATTAGNGTATVQALNSGVEATRTARESAATALQAVQATSEAVQSAYDDAAGEAATDKNYFQGG